MKQAKFLCTLLLLISFSNSIKAQDGTYHPDDAGNFFVCHLLEDGSIKLNMSMPSSGRNMCEDFEGVMVKDANGNFVIFINGDSDSTNMIIGIVKTEEDLINGVPKSIEVHSTGLTACDVPKGRYRFEELGD